MSADPPTPISTRASRPSLLRRLARGTAIAAATLVCTFALAELIARVFWSHVIVYGEPEAPKCLVAKSSDRHLVYDLVAGTHYTANYPDVPGRSPAMRVEYEINADGFRDAERFARPKPANTLRIAVVGDSFTFGIGVRAEETFPKVLEAKLREQFTGRTIEVMNCGVFGYNTQQEVALTKARVLDYQPDWVLICFYMNDVVPLVVKKVDRGFEALVTRLLGLTFDEPHSAHASTASEVQWWLREHSVLLDHLAANLELSLRNRSYDRTLRENWGVEDAIGWKEVTTYLSLFPDLCAKAGARPGLILFPDLTRLGERYPWRDQHAATRATCERIAIPMFDLLPFVEHEEPRDLMVHAVDHHPNAKCHRLVGEGLARLLAPELSRSAASPPLSKE